ncbi:RecQ family ATP-dependent DNA helicase [Vreelandella arcis]|uniref:DNA 3'-5' helicase n=1 Tax=Vreelandella arcis TaxID=416873 RepID=A0A1H0CY34_9GAMM|nr:RecQ family ATP-dependent DNA helicase [Halomonas arcis]SDN62541.1 ATP-dependent DNA helicase, RecQ-like [Halomonas arcis]
MNRDDAEALLRTAVGNASAAFRSDQWEAIDALVNKRKKLLVVQRTGWGKSSVYFIATRLMRDQGYGPTIIVSPLLALMRNQIEAAQRLGIHAVTINSTNRDQAESLIQQIHANRVDCLLISPEKLANEQFVEQALHPVLDRVGLLVVDEAHCISDWGHDFRPDYRRLLSILQQMPPNMPVLGTTATANDRVIADVVDQLGDIEVFRGPLVRDSLSLQNISLPDQASRLAWLSEMIPTLEGAGIVYVLTKRDAEQVKRWLLSQGIDAQAYYSGIEHPDFENSDQYREHLEDLLLNNQLKVLVATTALGMGYDKPDLHFVIHYQTPGSIVSYYQQVGRAGRGIDESLGILLSGTEDESIHEFFRRSAFPNQSQISQVLAVLEDSDSLSVPKLEERLNMRKGQIEKVLKFLSVENPAPVYKTGSQWIRTPVVYELDHDQVHRLTDMREQEWREIQQYSTSSACLMEYLRRFLDDPEAKPCGKCANCLGKPLIRGTPDHQTVIAAAQFLRHSEFVFKPKVQVAANGFPTYRLKGNLPQSLRAQEGRVLSQWADAAWGSMVEQDKHGGYFRDQLVDAMAEMIQQRWQPIPRPEWITCVPSLKHPELVPAFAARLASKLGLPFYPVISKVRDNEPQKLQNNRYHQCSNLDGVFSVDPNLPNGPVLLVDDVVDSGWTMAVLAALIRRQGSGEVYPVALASSANGD